jgi:hypothetical protein
MSQGRNAKCHWTLIYGHGIFAVGCRDSVGRDSIHGGRSGLYFKREREREMCEVIEAEEDLRAILPGENCRMSASAAAFIARGGDILTSRLLAAA